MAPSRLLRLLAASFVLLACRGAVDGGVSRPQCSPAFVSFCADATSSCNGRCGKKPEKPDGSDDVMDAIFAVAEVGPAILRSKFFDTATKLSGGGYTGAGILDGIEGVIDAGDKRSSWNRYKLESFVSSSGDFTVCEVQVIVGDAFRKYMDPQDMCHYNMGVDSMANQWLSSCHNRQCLNLTDRAADARGDCCTPSFEAAGNNFDCMPWTDEQISKGQGYCRLQNENFLPGSGVCTTERVCSSCMDIGKAITMTQAQIDSYQAAPTNWGDALDGYSNIDSVVAQARGTLMMISYYQELIFLGAPAALDNFKLFAKVAHEEMQSKVDSLMSNAPDSYCTLDLSLANVTGFLDILANYSQESLSLDLFGAYRTVGYRMPSCDAQTAGAAALAKCQHDPGQSSGTRRLRGKSHP